MKLSSLPARAAVFVPCWALAWSLAAGPAAAQAPAAPVYRCPGNPVLYTDQITAREAADRGCKSIEGTPITVLQGTKPRAPAAPAASGTAPRPEGSRVDPADQRARDSDARRILEDELRREEQRLAELKQEYNNGEPERRGDERNYAKYQERVADLKSAIGRKENDIASIKRELAKLNP